MPSVAFGEWTHETLTQDQVSEIINVLNERMGGLLNSGKCGELKVSVPKDRTISKLNGQDVDALAEYVYDDETIYIYADYHNHGYAECDDIIPSLYLYSTTETEFWQVILAHELGHYIYYCLIEKTIGPNNKEYFQIRKMWEDGPRKMAGISKYANHDAQEYFAETFAAFILFPAILQDADANGHEMISRALCHISET